MIETTSQDGDWEAIPVRVYFEDTDAQGVVYFANYLRFMERGRTEWLRARGIGQDELLREQNVCFSLIRTDARFHKPARFDDELSVRTRLVKAQGARVFFEQAVYRAEATPGDAAELLCSAACEVACLQADSFKPRRLPPDLFT